MNLRNSFSENPYRVLFLVGWASALCGSLSWLLFAMDFIAYPLQLHWGFFAHGFFPFFIGGFLLTALPRVKDFRKPPAGFVLLLLLISLTHLLLVMITEREHILSAVAFLFLLKLYVLSDIKKIISGMFTLIFPALLSGIIALIILYIHPHSGAHYEMYKAFYFKGMILALIISVGNFLVPKIMGYKETSTSKFHFQYMLLFYLGLIVDSVTTYSYSSYGLFLLLPLVTSVCLNSFKIFKTPPNKSALSIGVWISCWLLLTGVVFTSVESEWDAHLHHILYLGAYFMFTLGVSTRVILAHSDLKFDLESFEKNKKIYHSLFGLIFLSSITRSTVFVLDIETSADSITRHYIYAAAFLLVAIILWGQVFGKILAKDLIENHNRKVEHKK